VRVSGPQSRRCVESCFVADDGRDLASVDRPTAIAGVIRLPGVASPLSAELFLWPAARSYTGQPLAEIHTIGSPPLLQGLLRTLCAGDVRLAGPGEFTLRAFLSGRIDLTQAEAVLGVIDAADSHALDVALTQLAGGLAAPLHRLRDGLLDLLMHLEAGLDFAEEDITFIDRDELQQRIGDAEARVAVVVRQMAVRGEAVEVARVVLLGRPNAGKSSLFNALAGHAGGGAIVSAHPGTTRDYLTAELDLDGVRCQLVDTAGVLRDEQETPTRGRDALEGQLDVEHAAQSATDRQSRCSQVQLLCIDSTRPLDLWERGELERTDAGRRIVVLTKCDAPPQVDLADALRTSSTSGEGIASLEAELRRAILELRGGGDVVAATAVRCHDSLRQAGESLCRAKAIAGAGCDELVAAEIRTALEALGQVVGAVYTDDVLDRIFSRFCIGK
jgi:tRNA modification GTPase